MRLLIPALLLLSCNMADNNPKEISTEKLDTIQTRPAHLNAAPLIFEAAFITGTTGKLEKETVSLYGINIGNIKITSGKIIACDPMLMEEYGIPFTYTFPIGEFPVQFAIVKLGQEEEIAFARIKFSDEPVVRWEAALLPDQKPLPVGDEDIHGYIIDSGTGAFLDEDAEKAVDPSQVTAFGEGIYKEMDKHYHHSWRYALVNVGTTNMAAFSTGTGDGYYATYIGYDSAGKPCRLLSDFGLVDWRKK